ncbi:LysR substrate-binding domain-containing protein, partial [Phycicoccus flavus]
STRVTLHAANSAAVATAVRDGVADLGFVEGPVDRTGLSAADVGEDTLVLVAAPDDPWARRRTPVDAPAVAGRPLGSREPGSGTRRVWEDAVRAAGAEPAPPEVELDTTAALLASATSGGPPVVVSRRAAAPALATGALVEVRTRGIATRRVFTALWVGGRVPPRGAARDLVALIARSGQPQD